MREHPWRSLATLVVFVAVSWGLASWAVLRTLNIQHHGRVENCRAVNELTVQVRLAFIDAGYPTIGERFVPTTNCEGLP